MASGSVTISSVLDASRRGRPTRRPSPAGRGATLSVVERERVAIVGATGYTGVELVRLLSNHPRVELAALTGQKDAGKSMAQAWPAFAGLNLDIENDSALADLAGRGVDTVFLAMPHGQAAAKVEALLAAGLRVIDLSSDFRLENPADYVRHYDMIHPAPGLLPKAVYGLSEWLDGSLIDAPLVANPGCYATAILLGVLPAFAAGLYSGGPVVISAVSGISGAGRTPKQSNHFVEAEGNVAPYKVGESHQHLGEIKQSMRRALGGARDGFPVVFTPQVVPMSRGILANIVIPLKRPMSESEALAVYSARYAGRPFVNVLAGDQLPNTAAVRASNRCDLAVRVVAGGTQLLVLSAIDNLVKGAAGQAIQNFNLMHGFPEDMGLPRVGMPL